MQKIRIIVYIDETEQIPYVEKFCDDLKAYECGEYMKNIFDLVIEDYVRI